METKVIAIGAVDENWAAGFEGHLLFDNPEDLNRFADLTMGHTVVMGRKTFESLPNTSPLSGRVNVILTSDEFYDRPGCITLRNMKELEEFICDSDEEIIWIIGGQQIWDEALDLTDECYITSHRAKANQADTYFPNLDILDEWTIASIDGPHTTDEGIDYEYRIYRKLS